jgi:cyclopropane-fatty-acyl-phospholipid synthase
MMKDHNLSVATTAEPTLSRAAAPSPMARAVAPPAPVRRLTGKPTSRLTRWLMQRFLRVFGNPPIGITLWDGSQVEPEGVTPVARMVLRSRRAVRGLVVHPELHFGDLYSRDEIEVEGNLVEFLEQAYITMARNRPRDGHIRRLMRWRNRPRVNSLAGSRENIHHHYNLGNDFYRLWLDEEMQYTCAYFPNGNMTLEQAQRAKLDHVCRKLQLKPGQTVVEAGCGWGSLARHMALNYGVKVQAYNISREQIRYARERAAREGYTDRVEYVEDDYRNIRGQFDAFVSVGMLEHVGVEHYADMGEVIARVLRPDGCGLIHSIGRSRPEPMNAWIERRIFPGAQPPSIGEMMRIFEPREFTILDVENLRLHYAKTLGHWLWRFDKSSETVQSMFDERFVRAWRLYLAGSIAAFKTAELSLYQVVFTPRFNNDIPSSRAYLYREGH